MASGESGRLSVSEVSEIRENGRIRGNFSKTVQREVDGENRVFFVDPDRVEAAKAQLERMNLSDADGRDPRDAVAVTVVDETGEERGIPLSWIKE